MRKLIFIGVLVLAGCQNIAGPFAARPPVRVDDPNIPISEQERRGRDRLAMPDQTNDLPLGGVQPPGSVPRIGY
jgi:hypothetical protein